MLSVMQAQSGSHSPNSDLLHNREDEDTVQFLGTAEPLYWSAFVPEICSR